MLAGVLHNVGVLPMLAHCEPFQELYSDATALVRVLNEFAPQVGAMVLRKWELGEDLVRVALESHIWRRDPERHPELADVVLVARLHQLIGTPQAQRLPALDTLPAVTKVVGAETGPQGTLRVIEEARQELRELEQLLLA
jgi:HD-like signal output (HDOD) protein